MKKNIKRILIYSLLLVFGACSTQYISFRVKTDDALTLYRRAILNPDSNSILVNNFYSDKKKYSNRIRGVNSPIQVAALDQVSSQLSKLKKVSVDTKNLFEKYFTHNSCCENAEGVVVFARELLQPQTEYSHFATPFRNKSYVFYIFTDYDPKTGTGKYYQTDAFYPRDAFSFDAHDLCPANIPDMNKLEFFSGIFYLTYIETIQREVVSLLSPINDFNDRKVFIVDINDKDEMTFTKVFEYKIDNFYPMQNGNYAISQKKARLNCSNGNTARIFKTEIQELKLLKGPKAANAMINLNYNKNKQDMNVEESCTKTEDTTIDDTGFRDYPYPLKANCANIADSGWVFLGKTDTVSKIFTNETFYMYKKIKGRFPDRNREIMSYTTLKKYMTDNNQFRPFEVMKVRSRPFPGPGDHFYNWDDPSILGEAYDTLSYKIITDTIIHHFNKAECVYENMIWGKIQLVHQ